MNTVCLVNICVYYARQTREIYHVLPYSVDFKVPRAFWNVLTKTVVSKCSSIWNKLPETSDMTVKLKSNYMKEVGPVNNFHNFWLRLYPDPYVNSVESTTSSLHLSTSLKGRQLLLIREHRWRCFIRINEFLVKRLNGAKMVETLPRQRFLSLFQKNPSLFKLTFVGSRQ